MSTIGAGRRSGGGDVTVVDATVSATATTQHTTGTRCSLTGGCIAVYTQDIGRQSRGQRIEALAGLLTTTSLKCSVNLTLSFSFDAILAFVLLMAYLAITMTIMRRLVVVRIAITRIGGSVVVVRQMFGVHSTSLDVAIEARYFKEEDRAAVETWGRRANDAIVHVNDGLRNCDSDHVLDKDC